MRRTSVLALLVLLVPAAAGGQVRLEVELGWNKHAVSGQVNPLWIDAVNEAHTHVSGELVVVQRVESGWRGTSERRMVRPLDLGPGGRSRLVVPWPLGPGTERLVAEFRAGGEQLAQVNVPVNLASAPVALQVGRPAAAVEPDTVVVNPDDLPADPFVYSGVAGIRGAAEAPARGQIRDAVEVWRVLLAGRHGADDAVPHPSAEQVRKALWEARFAPQVWWWYLVGTVGFVAVMVWLVGRWGTGIRRWPGPAALALCAGLSLYAVVWCETPPTIITSTWSVRPIGVGPYELAWAGLFSRRDTEIALEGLWAPSPVVDEPLGARRITWSWAGGGWETRLRLPRGAPQIVWSLVRQRPIGDTQPLTADQVVSDKLLSLFGTVFSEQGEARYLQRVIGERGRREVHRVVVWDPQT